MNWKIAAAVIIIKFAKWIWGCIDTDYKKGQQRKNVDQSLNNVKLKLKKALYNDIDDLKKEVKIKQQVIDKNLWSMIDVVEEINCGLSRVSTKLNNLAKCVIVR